MLTILLGFLFLRNYLELPWERIISKVKQVNIQRQTPRFNFGKRRFLVQAMLNTTQPYQEDVVGAAADLLGYKIGKCNNQVFLKIDYSGNIGYKRLHQEEQNKFNKNVTSGEDWTWDHKTPLVAHLVLHYHAFHTELTWLGLTVRRTKTVMI